MSLQIAPVRRWFVKSSILVSTLWNEVWRQIQKVYWLHIVGNSNMFIHIIILCINDTCLHFKWMLHENYFLSWCEYKSWWMLKGASLQAVLGLQNSHELGPMFTLLKTFTANETKNSSEVRTSCVASIVHHLNLNCICNGLCCHCCSLAALPLPGCDLKVWSLWPFLQTGSEQYPALHMQIVELCWLLYANDGKGSH